MVRINIGAVVHGLIDCQEYAPCSAAVTDSGKEPELGALRGAALITGPQPTYWALIAPSPYLIRPEAGLGFSGRGQANSRMPATCSPCCVGWWNTAALILSSPSRPGHR
jgi:hypothetical protein